MKTNRIYLATFAIVLAATMASAQGRAFDGQRQGGPPDRMEMLAQRLNLSDSQKASVAAILNDAEAASRPVRQQMFKLQAALTDAAKNNLGDAKIEQIASQIGTLHAQELAGRAKADAKIYPLLTDEQKAKYSQGFGPGGFGGPGGGGPRGMGMGRPQQQQQPN